jgi:CheY-like chemotaxis protein
MNETQKVPEVLIVEDEAIISLDLKFKLKSMGFTEVRSAVSGEEALTMIREKAPDVILMDIILAGEMDGVETTELLNKESDIPVIYLTASSDTATLKRTLETGPAGYVHKPYNETNLRYTLEMALYKTAARKVLLKKEEELEKARQELQIKTEILQGILDNSPSRIHAKDLEGRYIFINKRYSEYHSITLEEAVGRKSSDLFPEATAAQACEHDREVVESGRAVTKSHIMPHDPAKKRWNTTKFPILDPRGNMIAVCGISTETEE